MKRNDALLDSGMWYFVDIREGDEKKRAILDQSEYNTFFEGLDKDGKFIKIGEYYHFWSKIDCFGPLPFEEGVLSTISGLSQPEQDFIKKRIRAGHNIYTLDKLRSEISFYSQK